MGEREYDEFAEFYDAFYAHRQAEIDFYTTLLRPEHRRVLELGCGTGIVLTGIAQMLTARLGSVQAIGIDRSAAMLQQARARAPHLGWIRGDMTRPPTNGRFDLIVSPFNTLQMLDSSVALLHTCRAVRSLLSETGVFALDIYNPACGAESGTTTEHVRRQGVAGTFADEAGVPFEIREEAEEEPSGEAVRLDWRLMDVSTPMARQRARLTIRLSHFFPTTLARVLQEAGLHVHATYGDIRRSPFVEMTSRKQVVVCGRDAVSAR